MLKISVFTKKQNKFITDFTTENIDSALSKMVTDYGEDHSEKFEIEIETINNQKDELSEGESTMNKTTLMPRYFEGKQQDIMIDCTYDEGIFKMNFEDSNRYIGVNPIKLLEVTKGFYNKSKGLKNIKVETDNQNSLIDGYIELRMNPHDVLTLKVENNIYHIDRYELYLAALSLSRLSGVQIEKPKKGYYSYAQFEKYVQTDEDWYPNIRGNMVRVFILCTVNQDKKEDAGLVRIGVWGNDDSGMELDFYGSEEESIKTFHSWKEDIYDKLPEIINRQSLKSLNFENA